MLPEPIIRQQNRKDDKIADIVTIVCKSMYLYYISIWTLNRLILHYKK